VGAVVGVGVGVTVGDVGVLVGVTVEEPVLLLDVCEGEPESDIQALRNIALTIRKGKNLFFMGLFSNFQSGQHIVVVTISSSPIRYKER